MAESITAQRISEEADAPPYEKPYAPVDICLVVTNTAHLAIECTQLGLHYRYLKYPYKYYLPFKVQPDYAASKDELGGFIFSGLPKEFDNLQCLRANYYYDVANGVNLRGEEDVRTIHYAEAYPSAYMMMYKSQPGGAVGKQATSQPDEPFLTINGLTYTLNATHPIVGDFGMTYKWNGTISGSITEIIDHYHAPNTFGWGELLAGSGPHGYFTCYRDAQGVHHIEWD